jgi:DNA-binding transcriptional LysR family regulator
MRYAFAWPRLHHLTPPKTPANSQPAWHRNPAPAVRHHCRTPNPIESFSPVGPASSRQNYILYNKRSVTFRLIENYFRRDQVVLNSVLEVGSMEATKELVKLGLGVCILAPWIARREIDEGSLVALPLGRKKLSRRWGILQWSGRRLSLAEETFVGLCRSACALFGHD